MNKLEKTSYEPKLMTSVEVNTTTEHFELVTPIRAIKLIEVVEAKNPPVNKVVDNTPKAHFFMCLLLYLLILIIYFVWTNLLMYLCCFH